MSTATSDQITWIETFLTSRGLYANHFDRLWAQLAAHRINERQSGDGTAITAERADQIINWLCRNHATPSDKPVGVLVRMPVRSAAQARRPRNDKPAEVGVYRQNGEIYVVREFTPQGEDRKVRYARKIVALRETQGDRLNGAGAKVRYDEAKAPGMQYKLSPAELLSIDEVKALSIEWEHCIICGHPLEVAESVERGIGPKCFKRQTAALALAA